MHTFTNSKPLRLLLLMLMALATGTVLAGCAAYTAANDENPGGQGFSGASSHSSTPHSH